MVDDRWPMAVLEYVTEGPRGAHPHFYLLDHLGEIHVPVYPERVRPMTDDERAAVRHVRWQVRT
jgi:hypothetical protein